MQRLEWHCHTKSISGALYKAILFQSVCRKRDGTQCCFQLPVERRQWLDFPDQSWKWIPGMRCSSRRRTIPNGGSTLQCIHM